MEQEKKEAEQEARADDALTKTAFATVRGQIKRLQDDEDVTVMPARKNKVPRASSPTSSSSSRAKLQSLVKKKTMVQCHSNTKVSSSLALLGAYSDESD